MSLRRWYWLAIVALTAFALVELGGRPAPSGEREPVPSGRQLAADRGSTKEAKIRHLRRGELVEGSLSKRPRLDYFLFVPPGAPADAPVLIAIHGISRNAREQVELFAPLAARHRFIVAAPLFDEERYEDYQRLGRRGRGPRADAALDSLIDELGRKGLASKEVFLFGYSGGAQFVHRYVMAHPERVRAGIVAAAGWYTFPDPSVDYPYGIRVDAELPGVRISPKAFLRVPMLTVVGDDDRERDDHLRQSRALDRQQGRNRVERARRWVQAMRTAAKKRELEPRVELTMIDGAGHSFEDSMKAGLGELVADYLIRWRGSLGRSGEGGPPAAQPMPPGSGRWFVGGR